MSEGTSKTELGSPIGYRGLAIIAALAIAHQVYLGTIEDVDAVGPTTFSYAISSLAAGIAAFLVARRYWGSEVFGQAYLALAIAFFLLFVGDLTYSYYEIVLNEDPYPSIADVFFLVFYPFAAFHLVRNITYFRRNLGWGPKAGVAVLTAIIVLAFAYESIDYMEEDTFDFFFGLAFVFGSAGILALAVLGAAVFRQSVLGTAWLLLAIGIFIFTIADVWYYILELTGGYDLAHPTNTLWFLSGMVVVYALYKHKKVI